MTWTATQIRYAGRYEVDGFICDGLAICQSTMGAPYWTILHQGSGQVIGEWFPGRQYAEQFVQQIMKWADWTTERNLMETDKAVAERVYELYIRGYTGCEDCSKCGAENCRSRMRGDGENG